MVQTDTASCDTPEEDCMYDNLTLFGTRHDTEWAFCCPKMGCVYEIECIYSLVKVSSAC